ITSCYLHNVTPSRVLDKWTPFGRYFHEKPKYERLRVFGCVCSASIPSKLRNDKFEEINVKCMMVGYNNSQAGYRLWVPETGQMVVSSQVNFDEDKFYFATASTDNIKLSDSGLLFGGGVAGGVSMYSAKITSDVPLVPII
ncbi:hypothetical protein WICMUC_000550, partial [Wickerhamomyces mucosus]